MYAKLLIPIVYGIFNHVIASIAGFVFRQDEISPF